MNFVNPLLFLAGIACLAIPVLVHLQRSRKPKRIVFSTLRLIDASQRISRKKRRITDWPLFLLRCLAVLFLAFVFSKLFVSGWSDGPKPQREAIALIIDRSASMNANGSSGTVQDEAIEAALEAIDDTGRASQIGVVLSPPTEERAPIRWVRPDAARRLVRSIKPSLHSSDLKTAVEKAAASLERFGPDFPRIIHLVSDLQPAAIDGFDALALPPNISIRVSKAGALEPENGGFRSGTRGRDVLRAGVYSFSSATADAISVRDRHYGDEDGNEPGKERQFSLAEAGSAISVPYTSESGFGWFARVVETEGNDIWAGDDTSFDAFYIPEPLPVILIEPAPSAETFLQKTFFISRALSPENYREEIAMRFRLQKTNPAAAANTLQSLIDAGSSRALIILPAVSSLPTAGIEALKNLVQSGAGLIVFGGPEVNANLYNQSLQGLLPVQIGGEEEVPVPLAAVSPRHPLWGTLDNRLRRRLRLLPLTHRHQVTGIPGASTLASFSDKVPLMVEKQFGDGNVIFVNASADRSWGKWQTDGTLFVVTMHLLASRAVDQEEDQWRNAVTQGIVGMDLTLTLSGASGNRVLQFNEEPVAVNDEGNLILTLPAEPGIYPLEDGEGRTIRLIAVNLPPEESNLQSVQAIVVQRQLENLRQSPEGTDAALLKKSSAGQGSIIWRTALILLALLLAGETLISNRFGAERSQT